MPTFDRTGEIHYLNETGKILRNRAGVEIRPGEDFWATGYEPNDLGLTILEDNTSDIILKIEELTLDATQVEVEIPVPTIHAFLVEVLVYQSEETGTVLVRFNKESNQAMPVDASIIYNEYVDTRKARSLFISGTGKAKIIFKDVLNTTGEDY